MKIKPILPWKINGSLSLDVLFLGISEFTPKLPTLVEVWNLWHIICCLKHTGDSYEQSLTLSYSVHSLQIKVINKSKIIKSHSVLYICTKSWLKVGKVKGCHTIAFEMRNFYITGYNNVNGEVYNISFSSVSQVLNFGTL